MYIDSYLKYNTKQCVYALLLLKQNGKGTDSAENGKQDYMDFYPEYTKNVKYKRQRLPIHALDI